MTGIEKRIDEQGEHGRQISHWTHYRNPPWKRADRDRVTVLLSVVEPRKARFVSAFLKRLGINHLDLGNFEHEDMMVGRQYCSPNLCNPVYFMTGRILRAVDGIRGRTGWTRAEIVDRYVFVCPSGPCSPCRYGMYTEEYFKAVNDAGYEGFRIITFSSDVFDMEYSEDDALRFDFAFRINLLVALILADAVAAREMETRPYEAVAGSTKAAVEEAERAICEAFRSRAWPVRIPRALERVGRMFDAVERADRKVPKIFITGEIFANNSTGDTNYHLRDFCMDQGFEVNPALFTQRVLFDSIRRRDNTERALRYGDPDAKERRRLRVFLFRQEIGLRLTRHLVSTYFRRIGARTEYPDIEALFDLAHPYYHRRIFGGEGNLEVAEAIEQSGRCHGFISIKPFGCMCSSGVSDGVQARIQDLHPGLNFLSVETSGDNATNVLNRVSMLLFKARRQHRAAMAAS